MARTWPQQRHGCALCALPARPARAMHILRDKREDVVGQKFEKRALPWKDIVSLQSFVVPPGIQPTCKAYLIAIVLHNHWVHPDLWDVGGKVKVDHGSKKKKSKKYEDRRILLYISISIYLDLDLYTYLYSARTCETLAGRSKLTIALRFATSTPRAAIQLYISYRFKYDLFTHTYLYIYLSIYTDSDRWW